MGATVAVEHSITGNTIDVDAQIHFLGYSTAWLAPPHEYVDVLSELLPGDYRLTLNLSRTYWTCPEHASVTQGFIDFTVATVPEPSTSFSLLIAFVALSVG